MPLPDDASGRGPSTRSLAVRGVAALLVAAAVVTLLLLQYNGVFEDSFRATALVSSVGDGLPIGSDVKHRGVLVGRVGEVHVQPSPQGVRHVIRLDLKPQYAPGIPASVKARIVPTNIFGAPSVDLAVSGPDTTPLARDATIMGDDSIEALQLQTALTKVRDVLSAVQPAKLNAALTSIASALDGRGKQLGDLIGRLDAYVTALNPHAQAFQADLGKLADVLEGLQRNAPALLDTFDSVLGATRTIVEKQQQLAATLAGADVTVDTVHGVLVDSADRTIGLIKRGAGVVNTLAADGPDITRSFTNLGQAVKSLSTSFSGPHGMFRLDLVISFSSYDPYTAADCPRYPGLAGPNCGNPVPAKPQQPAASVPTPAPPVPGLPNISGPLPGFLGLPLPNLFGGMVGPVGSPDEQDKINQILGLPPGTNNPVGSLLLGPIIRGTSVVMP
jgi:phospholipid/cholesterol/gamma-HCH transport system substrate-binding protein